jgi:RimJ/RimL family protein N-acetyltransferase
MREVCAALTGYGFALERGLDGESESLLRIEAGIFSGNVRSGRVLSRCGFRFEGVIRGSVWKWGERRDLEMYGMLREEWEEMRMLRERGEP